MTISEMNELKNEYGEDLQISLATYNPYSENKYDISYKGNIVGSELVSADFTRLNIEAIQILERCLQANS